MSITRGRQNSGRNAVRQHRRNRVYPGRRHDTRQHLNRQVPNRQHLNRRRHIPARHTMNRHDHRRIHYHHNRRHKFVGHYPFYHRKYIFFSLGGYWPGHYVYRRYYRYGYHPYQWYGRYPAIRVLGLHGNYYYSYEPYSTSGGYAFPDYDAYVPEPADETLADIYFEEGVRAFENGSYALAAEKFMQAIDVAPEDIVLPFVYVQAVFAIGDYGNAVAWLRHALSGLPAGESEIFYPRGLYRDDGTLQGQIDELTAMAQCSWSCWSR